MSVEIDEFEKWWAEVKAQTNFASESFVKDIAKSSFCVGYIRARLNDDNLCSCEHCQHCENVGK